MRSGANPSPSGRGRRVLALAVSFPVILSLLLAAFGSLRTGTRQEIPCWILPNLRAIATPAPDCALGTRDALRKAVVDGRTETISSLEALQDLIAASSESLLAIVERDGIQIPVDIPVRSTTRLERAARLATAAIGAALLMAVPFALVLYSSAPAATPLALFYCAFSVITVPFVSGQNTGSVAIAAFACMSIAPGTLFHLALCFPRESRLVKETPSVALIPYALGGFLLALGSFAVWRTPTLWPAFLYLLVGICAAAWTVLIFSCAFELRESRSPLARTRSKVVLFGSLLLPTLIAVPQALRGQGDQLAVIYLWSAAATMPLPIALAVSRYNLFDLGFDARQGVARVLYLTVSALVLASGAWLAAIVIGAREELPPPTSMLAVGLACALIVEPVRVRLPRMLESLILPRIQSLREAYVALERALATVDDEQHMIACVEKALMASIEPRTGALFLSSEGSHHLVHAFGALPPSSRKLAEAASAALAGDRILQVEAAPEESVDLETLRAGDVSLVASIRSGNDRLGVLLLGPPRAGSFYTGIEIDFVSSVTSRVGMAMFRARAGELRRARERKEAAGRLALALAHDTGKDIRWLKLLSQRLSAHPESSPRARRDASMIAELAEELSSSFQRVLAEASRASGPSVDLPRFDEVVERAVRRLGHLHGSGRVVEVIDPGLRDVGCPEYVGRLVGNVLDNALHASRESDSVRLYATLDGDQIRILVEDRGCGVSEEMRDRVFDPGVSTRRSDGGFGMGLTVAREIAEMLGGAVRLEPRKGGGTRAAIDLPRESFRREASV